MASVRRAASPDRNASIAALRELAAEGSSGRGAVGGGSLPVSVHHFRSAVTVSASSAGDCHGSM